jgi:hypothetical protein
MVQRDGLVDKLRVTADGTGVVGMRAVSCLAGRLTGLG